MLQGAKPDSFAETKSGLIVLSYGAAFELSSVWTVWASTNILEVDRYPLSNYSGFVNTSDRAILFSR